MITASKGDRAICMRLTMWFLFLMKHQGIHSNQNLQAKNSNKKIHYYEWLMVNHFNITDQKMCSTHGLLAYFIYFIFISIATVLFELFFGLIPSFISFSFQCFHFGEPKATRQNCIFKTSLWCVERKRKRNAINWNGVKLIVSATDQFRIECYFLMLFPLLSVCA